MLHQKKESHKMGELTPFIGHPANDVDTPALLIDKDRLEANIYRYAKIVAQAGVRLRPHIKTHKMLEVAALQLRAGAGGITTAKLSEAAVFASAGVNDIFVAYPIIGAEKARHAAEISQNCHLIVGVEHTKGIQQLSQAATKANTTIFVRIEINSGLNRTGVEPSAAADLCRQVLAAPGLTLDGIFTFRGISFPGAQTRDPALLGRQEGEFMVSLAEQLNKAAIPIKEISIGSTPTAPYAALVSGVTEVRPGTYVFFDRMTTRTGSNSPDEIALSILATVVSRPAPDIAVIDAGSKTFCGDVVPEKAGLEGYAITTDGQNGIVISMNEEHGIVRLAPGFSPEVGDKLAFFPNHVCTTINLSDEVVIIQNHVVQNVWTVSARGRRL
jgi:D-serine deaminase-like pyridoxal phosphate-dependent protein